MDIYYTIWLLRYLLESIIMGLWDGWLDAKSKVNTWQKRYQKKLVARQVHTRIYRIISDRRWHKQICFMQSKRLDQDYYGGDVCTSIKYKPLGKTSIMQMVQCSSSVVTFSSGFKMHCLSEINSLWYMGPVIYGRDTCLINTRKFIFQMVALSVAERYSPQCITFLLQHHWWVFKWLCMCFYKALWYFRAW